MAVVMGWRKDMQLVVLMVVLFVVGKGWKLDDWMVVWKAWMWENQRVVEKGVQRGVLMVDCWVCLLVVWKDLRMVAWISFIHHHESIRYSTVH